MVLSGACVESSTVIQSLVLTSQKAGSGNGLTLSSEVKSCNTRLTFVWLFPPAGPGQILRDCPRPLAGIHAITRDCSPVSSRDNVSIISQTSHVGTFAARQTVTARTAAIQP